MNITAAPTNATTTIDVARLIDEGRWTSYQKWLLTLVALTIVFDGVDNQLLGIALPAMMAELMAPIETPVTQSGRMPASARAS